MKNLFYPAALLLSLGACGKDNEATMACEDYNASVQACLSEMGVGGGSVSCDHVPASGVAYYDCLAELYDETECSSADNLPTEEDSRECSDLLP